MNIKAIPEKAEKKIRDYELIVHVVDIDSVVPQNVPFSVLTKVGLPELFYHGALYPQNYDWSKHDLSPSDIEWFSIRGVLEVESRDNPTGDTLQAAAEKYGNKLIAGKTVDLGKVRV